MSESSTIAGIATPFGQGALSIIRVSGPEAFALVDTCWQGRISLVEAQPRLANLGKIVGASGEVIDEAVVTCYRGPASFTGEDTVEITGHGGVLVTRRVLERLLSTGIESAGPGEFSQRAFVNGKMDLTQAEAVMDLISAQTDLALRAAHEQLEGRLGKRTLELRDQLTAVLAHVEAYIDFPEEDIDPSVGEGLLRKVDAVDQGIDQLLATAEQGRILREGVRTVIAGAPNVGKSSLLNQLLGFERAIVSEVAGTTRDTVEEVVNVRGIPLRLVDTAGLHETEDMIENQGIARSRQQLEQADLVLEVVDASQARGDRLDESTLSGHHHLLILNKSDLDEHADWKDCEGLRISCMEEEGLESLVDAIESELAMSGRDWGANLVAINARHQQCLKTSKEALLRGREQLDGGESPEFAALDLRDSLAALGEVVGRVDTEDILGEIFSSFCIGK